MRKYDGEPRGSRYRVRDAILIFPKTIRGETRWLEWACWNEYLTEIEINNKKSYVWKPTGWR